MPVPTRLMSPPLATPSRLDMRTVSNNTSYTPTVISVGGGQQKLNVVTRVAIEGKVKRGQKGASIRMYLKVLFDRFGAVVLFTECVDLCSTGYGYSRLLYSSVPRSVACAVISSRRLVLTSSSRGKHPSPQVPSASSGPQLSAI